MHTATILLGSNIDAELNLNLAIQALATECKIIKVSNIWLTKAVGSSGPDFLNQAVIIQTELEDEALKNITLGRIEKQLGRVRMVDKYAARTIDLDIIIFDGQIADSAIWQQCFIASPVSDLHPELRSAAKGRTLLEIAKELRCSADVKLYKKAG